MKGDNVLSPHNKREFQRIDESKKETQKDKIIDYCGNYVSGICVVFASEPLDTIKVRMQTFPTMYKNMLDCFRKTIKRDSKKGLFAGTTPAMVAGILDNTVSMIGYELSKVFLLALSGKKLSDELSVVQRATAGCITAGVSCLYLCPMDLLKCQLQAWRDIRDMHTRAGLNIKDIKPLHLMRLIVQQHSYRGLYCGWNITVAREVPGSLIFFMGLEGLKKILARPEDDPEELNIFKNIFAVSIAGCLLWLAIYPVDVIKSRVQVMTSKKTLQDVVIDMARREGVYTFYNGLKPTLVKTIVVTVVLLITHESTRQFLYFMWP